MHLFRRKSSKQTPPATASSIDVVDAVSGAGVDPALLPSRSVPDFEDQHLVLDDVEARLGAILTRRQHDDIESVEVNFSDGIEASAGRINDLDLRAAIDLDDAGDDSDFERRFAEFASQSDELRVQSWIDEY